MKSLRHLDSIVSKCLISMSKFPSALSTRVCYLVFPIVLGQHRKCSESTRGLDKEPLNREIKPLTTRPSIILMTTIFV